MRMNDLKAPRQKALAVSLSLLAGVGLALYAPFAPLTLAQAIVHGLIGLCLTFWAGKAFLAHVDRRRLRYGALASLPLAICATAGAELQVYGTFRLALGPMLLHFFTALGLSVFFGSLFLWLLACGGRWLQRLQTGPLEAWLSRLFKTTEPDGAHALPRAPKMFFFSFFSLFALWLLVFLAYYPGVANYDILSHLTQALSGQYSTLHPVLYTLFIKGCLSLSAAFGGGLTLAIAFVSLFQLLLMAYAIAHALSTLRAMGTPALVCMIALGFFGLHPAFSVLTLSTTKDIPFAAFSLLFLASLLPFFSQPARSMGSWRAVGRLCLFGALMGMNRYNGPLAMGLFALAALAFMRCPKEALPFPYFKIRTAALWLGIAVLSLCLNSGLNALVKAAPSFVTLRDIASLPSQQMVRAAQTLPENDADLQDIAQWYSGRSMLEKYRPRLADYTKRYIDVDHDDGWRGFARTWFRIGLKHPKAYIEAFLELNRGLWFLHDRSHAHIYPEGAYLTGYLSTNQPDCASTGDPIMYSSKLPGLQAFLDEVNANNAYENIPLLRMLFSTSFHCWLNLWIFIAACYRKDRALMNTQYFILSTILILFFSPCILARYLFPVLLSSGFAAPALTRKRIMGGLS